MDAHDLNTVAYPKLTQAQMAAFGGCSSATLKWYRDGERLFQAGDRDFGFFVVIRCCSMNRATCPRR